jgi:lipopolysaccharide transport system ATP-binding protein
VRGGRDKIAIRAEKLGKQYRIGTFKAPYATLRESLVGAVQAPFKFLRGRKDPADRTIWALKGVSFEVHHGEVVGIIGRNGAGKSTLLKILSRITEPTEGYAEIQGRIGSLLEVGTGFHPELTGRENIYLNGAILGMRKAEIDRKFDEIVAFAEVEKFLNTSVKYYSSGMYVRLAFSVAAHLEPEILLVDEVLAVGDAGFQKKCLGKMGEVAKEGRTVLFVSHNMAAVEALCNRAYWLKEGRLVDSGAVSDIIRRYLEDLSVLRSIPLRDRLDRQGRGHMILTDYCLMDNQGHEIEFAVSGQELNIVLSYEARDLVPLEDIIFGIGIFTLHGQNLIQCSNQLVGAEFNGLGRSGRIRCKIPRLPLAPGVFNLNFILRRKGEIEDWIQDAGQLMVEAGDFFGTGRLPPPSHGGLLVDQEWEVV